MTEKEKKCSETQVGRIVIHNHSGQERRIYKDQLEDFLSDDWMIGVSDGHRKSNSQSHIGHQPVNKGTTPSKETREKISNTLKEKYNSGEIEVWNKGKKGVQESWNKGQTKETNVSIKSASEKRMGHEVTLETREKLRKSHTGKKFGKRSPDVGKKISNAKMGHSVSQSTRLKISKTKTGKRLSPDKLLIKTTKQYLTKKKNNSFNTSKSEEDFYEFLLKENKNKTSTHEIQDSNCKITQVLLSYGCMLG